MVNACDAFTIHLSSIITAKFVTIAVRMVDIRYETKGRILFFWAAMQKKNT